MRKFTALVLVAPLLLVLTSCTELAEQRGDQWEESELRREYSKLSEDLRTEDIVVRSKEIPGSYYDLVCFDEVAYVEVPGSSLTPLPSHDSICSFEQ